MDQADGLGFQEVFCRGRLRGETGVLRVGIWIWGGNSRSGAGRRIWRGHCGKDLYAGYEINYLSVFLCLSKMDGDV